MAVPEQIPVVNYVADGIVKKFDVPFEYDQQSDLHVYVDGAEPTIDKYFFADNAFNFYIAPEDGTAVKIKRITPKERDTDYNLHTNTVRPKALNTDFDRLWYVLQEVFSDVGGLSQAVQDEIIARIQGDEDLLNQLTAEISARMLGDEAVTEDLKNYVDQVIGAIINDPSFDGIDADKVNDAGGETQQQVNYSGGSKWHSRVGGYKLNERVVLTNGDIVKSTIGGNMNDPNVDMTGWVNPIKDVADNLARFRDVLDYMENDGVSDVTTQLQALIATGGFWYIPEGIFNISTLFIPANTTIMTAGYKTVIQQVSGTLVGTHVICPAGRNISLYPSITIKGNIETDSNEQQHAIFIQANAANGSISNINIGDVRAENIRGDAVYFGQATGAQYKLSNINIGNVTGDNIYRNGVSVVSCNGFHINSIELTRVGMMDIDIEANIGSGVCRNGWIGYVKGKCIGGIAQTGADYVDNVTFDRVDLSFTDYINSSPEYPSYYKIPVLVRNIKSMQINHLTINGCDGLAIRRISGDASLDDGKLKIGRLTLRNGAKTSDTYDAYINCSNVEVDFLDADLSTQAGKFIFTASNLAKVNQAKVSLNATSSFFRSCNDPIVSRLQVLNNDGIIFNGGLRGNILNSSITVNRLGSFADKLFIENCIVTSSNLFVSNTDHFIVNSTLNSIYFGSGKFISAPVSKTYDWPSLAAGTVQSTTISVTGATVGSPVICYFNQPLLGTRIWAEVTAANVVTVYQENPTTAPVDVASGTLTVKLL